MPPAPEIIAYAIDDVPSIAGVTRTQVFEAIRAKELTARKRGRRTLIKASELRRWISTFPTRGRAPECHQVAAA
jgi:excisionase family DNA binding protein